MKSKNTSTETDYYPKKSVHSKCIGNMFSERFSQDRTLSMGSPLKIELIRNVAIYEESDIE